MKKPKLDRSLNRSTESHKIKLVWKRSTEPFRISDAIVVDNPYLNHKRKLIRWNGGVRFEKEK